MAESVNTEGMAESVNTEGMAESVNTEGMAESVNTKTDVHLAAVAHTTTLKSGHKNCITSPAKQTQRGQL